MPQGLQSDSLAVAVAIALWVKLVKHTKALKTICMKTMSLDSEWLQTQCISVGLSLKTFSLYIYNKFMSYTGYTHI